MAASVNTPLQVHTCLTGSSFWNLFNVKETLGDKIFFGAVVRNVSPKFLRKLTNYVYATLRQFREIIMAKVTFTCSKSTIEAHKKGVKYFES